MFTSITKIGMDFISQCQQEIIKVPKLVVCDPPGNVNKSFIEYCNTHEDFRRQVNRNLRIDITRYFVNKYYPNNPHNEKIIALIGDMELVEYMAIMDGEFNILMPYNGTDIVTTINKDASISRYEIDGIEFYTNFKTVDELYKCIDKDINFLEQ